MNRRISIPIFLLLLLIYSSSFSQTYCESFDGVSVPSGNKAHAFNIYGNGSAGFLQDWFVPSGTPSVYASGDIGSINAYNGNQYALVGVCDVSNTWADGLMLEYNFAQNQAYDISAMIRNAPAVTNPTPIDVEFILLQSIVPYTYNPNTGCSALPSIPAGARVVHTITGFSQNSWQASSFNTGNLTTNYTHLWIRPKFSSGSPLITTYFLMDSMCVQPVPAQSSCYSFDDISLPSGNKAHAFNIYGNGNAGFLQDWFVPSGTPSVYASGDIGSINAYNGNQYALVGVCDVSNTWADGLMLQYNFAQNQSYNISSMIRNAPAVTNPTPIDVEFILLQSIVPYTYNPNTGCSATPSIPIGANISHTITGFSQNSWQSMSYNTGNLTANYTYLWIRPKFSNGSPLITTYLLLDSMCISSQAVSCSNNTLQLSMNATGISCNHPQDTVSVAVSGGTTPYSFVWSTGATTPEIVTSQPGIYRVTVTDDSLCTRIGIDTVLNLGLVVSLQSSSPVTCNGNSNGKLDVSVAGGVPPYTYLWSNGAATDSIFGLSVGSYTLTVTDAASCTATFTRSISQTSTNWSFYTNVSRINSNCTNNGSATVNVSGGTSPFTYLWSNGQTTQTATGLAPGSYTVTVTGSDGCMRTGSTQIYSSCKNVIQGLAFSDTNGNCVRESGESTLSGVTVVASNGINTYYGYVSGSGNYTILIGTAGTFTVTSSISNGWGNCAGLVACTGQQVTFPGLGDTSSVNLGFTASGTFDLAVSATWNGANPGFTKHYTIRPFQQSVPLYLDTATIVLLYDSILVYQSSQQGGVHDSASRTVTWKMDSVAHSYSNTSLHAYFTVPVGTPVNYQLRQDFFIYPVAGDCDTSDNHWFRIQSVTSSYDPNEKEVEPAGNIYEEDSALTYTIHFQNTGNDTTWFVIVKDTLSAFLNAASVQNLASSHPYSSFDITDNGILTWVFDPIYLVDSMTNEPESKGFVTFRVKKKGGLPVNTEISNSASIYFDYNEPILTNTVTNTVALHVSIKGMRGDDDLSVVIMPNPFNEAAQLVVSGTNSAFDFELFDISGKSLRWVHSENKSIKLERENLSAGVYFYKITTTDRKNAFGRLIVQ